jgi:ATP-dependent Lon protease
MGILSQSYTLPVLPLRRGVVFPGFAMPITIHGEVSTALVEAVTGSDMKRVALFALKNRDEENPGPKDFYPIGTTANITVITKFGTTVQILLQSLERVEIVQFVQTEPYFKAQLHPLPVVLTKSIEGEALQRDVLDLSSRYLELGHPELQQNLPLAVSAEDGFLSLLYTVANLLQLDLDKDQSILEAATDAEVMEILRGFLLHEIQILELRKKMTDQAQETMNKEKRDYILREQIKAMQQELGEGAPESGASELREKFEQATLPEGVQVEVEKEMARIEQTPSSSPEYQVLLSHLNLILDLPWGKATVDNLDLENARQVLDEDHFNLKEVKERIIEQLAVMKLNPEAKAPILCFVGPPGVGKTSLGQSIARALNRKFDRFSLGGMHDEAELRGHRRTYIGAMPGRIIQALRRAEAINPLIMLDEIDKVGHDFRGDPASALMEVLDPEQNNSFHDNYLDLPFDLSKVFFITTANAIDTISKPLLDRMEVLRLSGYSDEEKIEIAKRYLFPRQRSESGLSEDQLQISDDVMATIIRRYTREAGVRELERMLGRLARKIAVPFAEGKRAPATIEVGDLPEMLGPERFFAEQIRKELPAGVATGLAWTESGGDVLYIEAIELPEGEPLTMTGHLGEVMKESAMTANSYVLSQSQALKITPPKSVHIHVPAGAIPKDGPSAGVTIATALASLYTKNAVRSDTAMTGEITLSGLVLPVGGIKEKILAARRAGIHRVIMPLENKKDLTTLPDEVQAGMELIFVERIEEVLAAAIQERSTDNSVS